MTRIPDSPNTVKVSIIDSTSRIKIPFAGFVRPTIPGHEWLACPAYSFLIENERLGKKYLFDLGVRKDWENLPAFVVTRLKGIGAEITVEKNVVEILGDVHGTVDGIIWSHSHFDHTGDPSGFPSTTELVVGPGLSAAQVPGFPAGAASPICQSDHAGRPLREVTFDDALHINGMQALDFFEDGSFYLLNAPGHAVGHICGLARTNASPPSFILMGADTCHHGGQFRPTEQMPLPTLIMPSPFSSTSPIHPSPGICPGSLITSDVHPHRSTVRPFYNVTDAPGRDTQLAEQAVTHLQDFDADENVFVVIAHDASLLGVVDFWPLSANTWKEKGWKEKTRWLFLKDIVVGREQAEREKGKG
ncbi:hypothetical protein HKX48_006095 [Thoreauomyces humboldtii]|nr:hypothetical protein HKX48_006095 [Thoreauomyces humboldtii]